MGPIRPRVASAVALFARVGPDGGRIRVVVDGKPAGSFTQQVGARAFRTLTFRRSWRRAGRIRSGW